MNNWKSILLLIIFGVLNFLFVQWNKNQVVRNRNIQEHLKEIKLSKDSLFILADSVAENVDRQRQEQISEINKLKTLLSIQTEKSKIINTKAESNQLKNSYNTESKLDSDSKDADKFQKMMSSDTKNESFYIERLENEVFMREQTIDRLMIENNYLLSEIDSLKLLLQNKQTNQSLEK